MITEDKIIEILYLDNDFYRIFDKRTFKSSSSNPFNFIHHATTA